MRRRSVSCKGRVCVDYLGRAGSQAGRQAAGTRGLASSPPARLPACPSALAPLDDFFFSSSSSAYARPPAQLGGHTVTSRRAASAARSRQQAHPPASPPARRLASLAGPFFLLPLLEQTSKRTNAHTRLPACRRRRPFFLADWLEYSVCVRACVRACVCVKRCEWAPRAQVLLLPAQAGRAKDTTLARSLFLGARHRK